MDPRESVALSGREYTITGMVANSTGLPRLKAAYRTLRPVPSEATMRIDVKSAAYAAMLVVWIPTVLGATGPWWDGIRFAAFGLFVPLATWLLIQYYREG